MAAIRALLGYGPGLWWSPQLLSRNISGRCENKMSIEFHELTADQKIKAASHNLLLVFELKFLVWP